MIETAPTVALLFDDTELGGQLREALQERGARIVHEGGVSSLSRELLDKVGAEVLVVNLDDSADDALDQLYEVMDGDRPRVVFNDAQASRALAGWDRARWARHLAVKVLAAGDVDPPRPGDARVIETPVATPPAPTSGETSSVVDVVDVAEATTPEMMAAAMDAVLAANDVLLSAEADLSVHDDDDGQHGQLASAESENLAAELEALLASDELPVAEDVESGSGLRYAQDDELPPLHDGNFGMPAETPHAEVAGGLDELLSAGLHGTDENAAGVPVPRSRLDDLQLSPMLDASVVTMSAMVAEQSPADIPTTRAFASWALLDDETPSPAFTGVNPEKSGAAAFGIEKLSAADFLAPDVEQVAAGVQPVMNLELMSIEEAIAPRAYEHISEMMLDDTGTALSRIVLLGAAVSGVESVGLFLAALPATTRSTFLLTQHLDGQPAEAMVEKLAANCTLPVRVAVQGGRARLGEVLVVPSEQQARLRRDGSIELHADASGAVQNPSIDASFTMAANAFGRDALAIVFAGRATDAVAGSQAIHDRGGQV
ncbi:MAG TPA: chemotaxis protein CheB, partial [Rhodanobacter sp.]